ncbi:MAG TPA: iron export ABC transporter permease subunit FetB [Mycobacteriales bacterium]|nr:iron export ABC transporter permease subunit FetB [Mycobacteriales bacterium]
MTVAQAVAAHHVYVPSWPAVAASALLVAACIAVVARERLGLAREVAVATVRAAVQLVAVGALLAWLFEHAGLAGSLGWVAAMVLVAGGVSARRGRGLRGVRAVSTTAVAVAVAVTLGLLVVTHAVTTEPRVLVPIGGMVVSGALQATSLTLLRIRDAVSENRPQVEARLALGQSARQAFAPQLRAALRNALVPTIDTTKVVGLISLPGAMTGLIIAGVPPLDAIRYQIVVMYMLLGAWAVAGLVAGRMVEHTIFDEAHRLRPLLRHGMTTARPSRRPARNRS